LSDLDQHMEELKLRNIESSKVVESCIKEQESLIEEKTKLISLIKEQEKNDINLQKFREENRLLDENIQALLNFKKNLENNFSDKQIEYSYNISEVAKLIEHFNGICTNLNLIPSTSNQAKGRNYRIMLNKKPPQANPDIKKELKPLLKQTITEFKEITNKSNTKLMKINNEFDQVNEECRSLGRILEQINIQKDQIENQEKNLRQSLHIKIQEQQSKIEKLKNHQETKNQPIDEKSTVNYWENQLKDLNQEYKTTKEEIEKKEKELYEQAFNTLTRFSYFFLKIQEQTWKT